MAKVRVPERHGSVITISRGGAEARDYHVREGHVTVADEDLGEFLAVIEGAERVDAGPKSSSETGGSSQKAESPSKEA